MSELEIKVACSTKPVALGSDLQTLIQPLLATLADLEFDYEREREKAVRDTQDAALRIRVLQKLKSRHAERREPYVQQLAILQECLRERMGL